MKTGDLVKLRILRKNHNFPSTMTDEDLVNETFKVIGICGEHIDLAYSNGDKVLNTVFHENELILVGHENSNKPKYTNFTVYRVYDDEWEEIMGIGQLTEFALNQLCDKYDDFVWESEQIEDYHDKDLVRRIKELGKKVFEDKNENLTISEIETVFEAFYFEYERVTLY